ncbi:MAG: FIST N-terminal domain-containing protein [candidate division FCPU426 bacterium]
MKWSSAVSGELEAQDALRDCVDKIRRDLGGQKPDALFVFVSPHHSDSYDAILAGLNSGLQPRHLMGCSGGGVIGAGHEVEEGPGLSVTAALMPGVTIRSIKLDDADLPDADSPPSAWEAALGVRASDRPEFLLLASPFMGRAEDLLAGLDYAFPMAQKVGGMASGLRGIGERAMFLGEERVSDGAILLAFSGELRLDTLVAQGCRGVGGVHTITRCEKNLLQELDGKPALKLLTEIYEAATPPDRQLMNRALFIGLITDPLAAWPPEHGDFLIRNVLGIDAGERSIAVGAMLREGQALRFHVRDSGAAAQDLKSLLQRHQKHGAPSGALLFSCLGRGEGMYGVPDHDSRLFAESFGPVPLGGFFCNGEIGQVGQGTYIHGFTSSFGLFREK